MNTKERMKEREREKKKKKCNGPRNRLCNTPQKCAHHNSHCSGGVVVAGGHKLVRSLTGLMSLRMRHTTNSAHHAAHAPHKPCTKKNHGLPHYYWTRHSHTTHHHTMTGKHAEPAGAPNRELSLDDTRCCDFRCALHAISGPSDFSFFSIFSSFFLFFVVSRYTIFVPTPHVDRSLTGIISKLRLVLVGTSRTRPLPRLCPCAPASLLLMCIEIMSHPALVDIIVQNGPHHAQRVVDPPLRPPSKQAKPNCIRDMQPRKRKVDYGAAFPAPAYNWLFPAQ